LRMTANEAFPKPNHLVNRIQAVSVYLRYIFLGGAVAFGLIGALGFVINAVDRYIHGAYTYPMLSFYADGLLLGRALEFWLAYQLFTCYVRGDWFAPKAIRCMRWVGIISLLMGGTNILWMLNNHFYDTFLHNPLPFPPGFKIIFLLQIICNHLVFNLVSGLVIILIAWIMDEGRKIREEQELTV
jgi:Protein of unknown function (DUF2975)